MEELFNTFAVLANSMHIRATIRTILLNIHLLIERKISEN